MISRRTFPYVAAGGLFGAPPACAQQADRVWRVGILKAFPRPPDGSVDASLRKAIEEVGFIEGKNIVFESRWGEARYERLPALAAELVALKVDLIVTVGGASAIAAKNATSTIPIVVIFPGDVVDTGLVSSLARPGGNVTGVNDPASILSGKRLELLKEMAPAAKRIAVLWNTADPAMNLRYREIERAAQLLRVSVEPLGVREPQDFEAAVATMDRSRPDALMVLTDALTVVNRQRVLDYVATQRIPAIYEFAFWVQLGGLMSYGSDLDDNYKIAARHISKILNGTKPSDLPVEQPNRYLGAINQKTARTMRIEVPRAILLRADQVIE